ncbi:Gfo/Idh/MocA family protein [Halarchaeum sp. P4]|uniref:Gfo/Idh/MocA family protein n=1 Tax=Halarchaeum sp. P4 TaxID=3421639 RepID=UPI003EBD381F
MPEPTAVAVLGAGHIGTVHVESVHAMTGAHVRAVADQIAGNRERARECCGCATYADYEALLAEEAIDVAVVALPPFLHADAAIAAADHDCHVFVEKPLAPTSAAGERILDAARDAGVAVGVDHTLRYMPAMRELKRRYDDGAFGHVPICRATRVNDGPFGSPPDGSEPSAWKLDPDATGGGALMDLGVHLFDVLRWFFGDVEVEHATFSRQLDVPYEDTATVVTSTEAGTTATLDCGFFQREDPEDVTLDVRLDGVAGTGRRADHAPDDQIRHAAREAVGNVARHLTGRDPEPFTPTYYYRAHFEALRSFVRAVRVGEHPPVSGIDGLRAVELVEAAYDAGDGDWPHAPDPSTRERTPTRPRGE